MAGEEAQRNEFAAASGEAEPRGPTMSNNLRLIGKS